MSNTVESNGAESADSARRSKLTKVSKMVPMPGLQSAVNRVQRGVRRTSMSVGPSGRSGPRALVTSLPKSGTHLLSSVLAQFPELSKYPGNRIDPPPPWSWLPGGDDQITLGVGQPRGTDRTKLRRFLSALHPGLFITGHVPFSEDLAADLGDLDYRLIAMVRDPRAVVVSKVRFANSIPEGRLDREMMEGKSSEEQISLATEGYSLRAGGEPIHIGERLEKILAWERHGALIVRFEDLVGTKGGGTGELQMETIRAIRNHLGLPVDEAIEAMAAANSYGKSPTFRSGRSKSWQDDLSADQIARIEVLAGDAMGRLGYLDTDS